MTDRTPYDTGSRAQPLAWVRNAGGEWIAGSEYQRPAEPDDFGRVDFDGDDGSTLATVYAERTTSGGYVLDVYAHDDAVIVRESNDDAHAGILAALTAYTLATEAAVNLSADAEDADDLMRADYDIEKAAREFAPHAARWIAARLGVEA